MSRLFVAHFIMKKTSTMGRPMLPQEEKRGEFVGTRVSPPEHAEIKKAARKAGEAKTEWVRKRLLAAARRA